MPKKGKKAASTIVIRREEIVSGAHHSGAWKVAYADFVTAMMAFFLLMWLVNATTEKQRRGLADYFSPVGPTTRSTSGNGKPFGGLTPNETGSMVSNRGFVSNTDQTGRPPSDEQPTPEAPSSIGSPGGLATGAAGQRGVPPGVAKFAALSTDPDAIPIDGDSDQPGASGRADADRDADQDAGAPPVITHDVVAMDNPTPSVSVLAREADSSIADKLAQQRLATVAAAIKRALRSDPAIGDYARQVAIDLTPDELRIQIFDAEGKPMFDPGATVPNQRARLILAQIAPVLAHLDEPISIVGHTDATPCLGRCRSNWDLSSARADSTRAALVANGLSDQQVAGVAGLADHDLLLPSQPTAAANRRVVMIIHRRQSSAAGGVSQ